MQIKACLYGIFEMDDSLNKNFRRGDESGIADGFSGAVDGEEKV